MWYANRCFECHRPLTRFWIENGPGINNLKGGFKPQLIIKAECLYYHNTYEHEYYQMPLDLNDSFSMPIYDMRDDEQNGDEEREHPDNDDPNDDH